MPTSVPNNADFVRSLITDYGVDVHYLWFFKNHVTESKQDQEYIHTLAHKIARCVAFKTGIMTLPVHLVCEGLWTSLVITFSFENCWLFCNFRNQKFGK